MKPIIDTKPNSTKEATKLFNELKMVKTTHSILENYFKKNTKVNVSIIGNK